MSKTAVGILMASLSFVAIFVALMLSIFAFSARDDFGRVELPGSEVLHFPKGRIHVTYEERTGRSKIKPPGSLAIVIQPAAGGPPIEYTPSVGSSTSNTTNSSRRALSGFDSPADGDYLVTAEAPGAGPGANLQFGKGFWYALFHGVPLYILLGAVLLFIAGAFVSTRPVDERVEMPAQ